MGGPRCAVSRSKLVAPELGRSRRMARCVAEIYSSDQGHRSATLVTHVFVSNLLSALCSLLTFVSLRPPARPSILLAFTTTLGHSKAQLHRRHSSDLTPVEAFPTIHLARSKSFSPCLIYSSGLGIAEPQICQPSKYQIATTTCLPCRRHLCRVSTAGTVLFLLWTSPPFLRQSSHLPNCRPTVMELQLQILQRPTRTTTLSPMQTIGLGASVRI